MISKRIASCPVYRQKRDRLLCFVMIFTASILFMSPSSWSSSWQCVSWDKYENCSVFYNQNIKHTKNIVNVSTRRVLTEDHREMDKDLANDVSHVEYLESYNCVNATSRILSIKTFRSDRTYRQIELQHSRYSEIVPGSTNEAVFKIVCKKTSVKARKKPKKKKK